MEGALISRETRGRRTADSGTQPIRLISARPQRLRCIAFVFGEVETGRTQEFVLRAFLEIVCQK